MEVNGISVQGVGYSVGRGEAIAHKNDHQLIEWVSESSKGAMRKVVYYPKSFLVPGTTAPF
jgi:hypothetical protein